MSQAEGTGCRKRGKGPVCSPLGLELAQNFLDCKKWSLGKEKYICGSFRFHFKRNVHRRDVVESLKKGVTIRQRMPGVRAHFCLSGFYLSGLW